MGTLVVTTDLSELSRRALPVARRMADGLGAELVLLHIVHSPTLAPALSGSIDLDVADAEKALAEQAKDLGTVTTRVIEAEDVVPALVAEAATADMLVMASHGRTGLKRLALGSVVEAVLEAASTPVLCVPAGLDPPGTG